MLNAVVSSLLTVLVVVVLRLALKRNWLALPISVVLLSTSLNYIGGSGPWMLLFSPHRRRPARDHRHCAIRTAGTRDRTRGVELDLHGADEIRHERLVGDAS